MALKSNRVMRSGVTSFTEMPNLKRLHWLKPARRGKILMNIKRENQANRELVDDWDSVKEKQRRLEMIRAAAKRVKI